MKQLTFEFIIIYFPFKKFNNKPTLLLTYLGRVQFHGIEID
jgi:hypothetical protein